MIAPANAEIQRLQNNQGLSRVDDQLDKSMSLRSEVSSLASRDSVDLYINLADGCLQPASTPVIPGTTTPVATREPALVGVMVLALLVIPSQSNLMIVRVTLQFLQAICPTSKSSHQW